MPNPPYTVSVIVIEEGPDGFTASVVAWDDKVAIDPSTLEAPRYEGVIQALKNSTPKPTYFVRRTAATRAVLKTLFGTLVDLKFPDTA